MINYVLSVVFVFRSAKSNPASRTSSAFFAFVSLGFIGFLLTEGGMYLGVGILALNYRFAKILVTGIVLAWNYLSRKILISKGRSQ